MQQHIGKVCAVLVLGESAQAVLWRLIRVANGGEPAVPAYPAEAYSVGVQVVVGTVAVAMLYGIWTITKEWLVPAFRQNKQK